tara:strand:+ start:711 stop:1319 length:609 start_codon:yes stop_codon:yes gene_type:complete
MILKIHRLLGITLVFFVVILSVTGTLLQHAEDFNIRQNYASSDTAKNFYNIKPCVVYSISIEKRWVSICNNNLFFDDVRIANNISDLNSVYKKGNLYFVQYDGHKITINDNAEIINMKHLEKTNLKEKKVLLKRNIIPDNLRKNVENESLSKTITYERIIVDIHTGRLFGNIGVTLVDLVTIGLLILSITGTISWLRHKKIF